MLRIIPNFRKACVRAFALGLCTLAAAQKVTTVYSFDVTHGQFPYLVTLTQGRDGWLYGTTTDGGTNLGTGTIFKQRTAHNRNVVLYDGLGSAVGVTLASDGNYYGTTQYGGTLGLGVLYKVTSAGVMTVLHDFMGGSDGAYPLGPPIQASDGDLYGVAGGGAGIQIPTVYKATPAGGFSTLYSFGDVNDTLYFLLQGADGDLYVTLGGVGSIAKISLTGVLRFRRNFDGKFGIYPNELMQASDGNFYGTNFRGGACDRGTIYRMSPRGVFTLLYSFVAADGYYPSTGLTQASDGNLYGSTEDGGDGGSGSLYKFTLDGVYTHIHSFPQTIPRPSPTGSLTQSTNGRLYGTTYSGGAFGLGSVFSLDMGLGPFVALQRYQGKPGSTTGILGQGFTGTIGVTFNGVPATSFTVLEDTYMTAVVPSGAGTGPGSWSPL